MSEALAEARSPVPAPAQLSQRAIFRLFYPLALSWIFMATESPVSNAILARSPNATVNTAAFLMLMAIAIFIESPVIDLLSTSTTLATGRTAYHAIRRFTVQIMIGVTIVHALVVLTPFYFVLTRTVLGLPEPVIQALHVPLQIMIPWSAFIGWRRHLQGLMIRTGATQPIGVGTFLRVATITGVGFGIMNRFGLTGLEVVAIALLASVAVEAVFMHWASRPTVHALEEAPDILPAHRNGDAAETLSTRRLWQFHGPLTLSSLVMLTTGPAVGAALARTPDAVVSMAAWQVASSLIWLMRTVTYALPEVVIAQYQGVASRAPLAAFCRNVGLTCSGLMLLAAVTGLDRWMFTVVLGVKPSVADSAHLAFWACVPLPALNAAMSYTRGVLTAHRQTMARMWAISVGVATLIGTLVVGVSAKWPGIVLGPVAVILGQVAEMIVLRVFWSLTLRREPPALAPSA